MILRFKYFGMIAEALSKKEESLEFNGRTISDLTSFITTHHPKLESMDFKLAVNQSLVRDNEHLNDNDEVAIIPPFAGG
jgi:molybdopterin converting factor small subunit